VATWSGNARAGADDMSLALVLDPAAAEKLAAIGLRLPQRQATAMAAQD
jgi:hypothetical protein